jgi:hypothetical protein
MRASHVLLGEQAMPQYVWGHPQLFVTGGLGGDSKALNDGWILDVHSGGWREVRKWSVC